MRRFRLPLISCLFVISAGAWGESISNDRNVQIVGLRCEYKVDPLGISEVRPRLGWLLESSTRGQRQTGYRILVAGSEKKLAADVGDMWDTAKLDSDASNQIVYEGKPLQSRDRCFWKVRVWDKDGKASAWSEPSMWTMGLLQKSDWQAKWIGYDAAPDSVYEDKDTSLLQLNDCDWMTLDESEQTGGRRFFRGKVQVGPQDEVKRIRLILASGNRYTVFINGQLTGTFTAWISAPVIEVEGQLRTGQNTIAISAAGLDDPKLPTGIAGKIVIEHYEEAPDILKIDKSWKVSKSAKQGWEAENFDDSDWTQAVTGKRPNPKKWAKVDISKPTLPPVPYLRKEFTVAKAIKRATLYATALGLYELHINGKRVGADYFTPGWTDYDTRVYYQTYDVTALLKTGDNAIGASLADGWYAGYLGGGMERERYGDKPRLLAQLEIEYDDGSTTKIVTDASWKAACGPLLEADLLMGETYDARKEFAAWSRPHFDDSNWKPVALTQEIPAIIEAHPGVPVRKVQEIRPVRITEPRRGRHTFDMGQNFAGWARLKVTGRRGDKITMRFAERLNPDGTIYTTNLRHARATDTYICKGEPIEQWEPRFTYHGFQYVEVTGLREKPTPDTVTGIVLHSDTPTAGHFECSNEMINKLYSNIVWGQRSNFLEVPTDCPQRDERLGWTGDAQIFIATAAYNMDVSAFFTKWLVDLEDAQTEDGAFPNVAPRKAAMNVGISGWADAGIICPWTIWKTYGDTRVIEKHYDPMTKWLAHLQQNSHNYLRPPKGFGDWLSIGEETPKDVIATAYFAHSANLLSQMAAAIGKHDDAQKYQKLFEEIRSAFNNAYVSDDGKIKGDTQTAYALAIRFGLLANDKAKQASQHLVKAIERRNWHLSTGFLGLTYLCPVLTQTGHLNVAYRLLNNDTFPSWLYPVKNGATTIWERWDGWTQENGFQDPGMNSFNHYAYGSVGQWLFTTVAGIEPAAPGYKKIIIRPQPGGTITWASAEYNSIHGRISTSWKIQDSAFTLNVTIPPNTEAEVYLPPTDKQTIQESARPVSNAEGVEFLREKGDAIVYRVLPGDYSFELAYNPPPAVK